MLDTYRKIYAMLSRRERKRFVLLMLMILVMGLLDAVGVASIFPFLSVLSNPGVVETNRFLAAGYRYGEFHDTQSYLLAIGILIFAIIVMGLAFKLLTLYAVIRFGHMRKYTLGLRLLKLYVGQSFDWHLNRHSAQLTKNIMSEVDEVVARVILPSVRVISFSVIAFCIVLLLVIVDPIVSIVVPSVIIGCYSLAFFVMRQILLRIGKERRAANRECFQVTQECFGGIKHIKLKSLEAEFVRRFNSASFRLAARMASADAISELPRQVLEALLIGGIMVVVLWKLQTTGGDLGKSLPIIGLYAFAGIRLFPATQTIYQNIARMRFGKPALDALYDDLSQQPTEVAKISDSGRRHDQTPLLENALELRNISFSYPESGRTAINGVSLRIEARTTVAFVGRTGSGKTTLSDIVLGLLRPAEGQVIVDGKEIGPENLRHWQSRIGYVPQDIFLSDDTVRNNIAFGLPESEIDREAVERAARLAELHDFVVSQLPKGYDTMVGERGVRLSGGQRQRIGIARALFGDPDLLVLDEATSALDNMTERAVMDAVQNLARKKTIIMIAHRLSTVRNCDMIFLIEGGRLKAKGKYEELVEMDDQFRSMVYD